MFFLVVIQEFTDESPMAKAIYDYDSYDATLSVFFSTMASSMANWSIQRVTCLIMNAKCSTIKYERWERATIEVTPSTDI